MASLYNNQPVPYTALPVKQNNPVLNKALYQICFQANLKAANAPYGLFPDQGHAPELPYQAEILYQAEAP